MRSRERVVTIASQVLKRATAERARLAQTGPSRLFFEEMELEQGVACMYCEYQ